MIIVVAPYLFYCQKRSVVSRLLAPVRGRLQGLCQFLPLYLVTLENLVGIPTGKPTPFRSFSVCSAFDIRTRR